MKSALNCSLFILSVVSMSAFAAASSGMAVLSKTFSPHDGAGPCATMVDVDGCEMIPNYYYFYNLETNFPYNVNGECTWVAATMYLSYLEVTGRSGTISSNYLVHSYGTSSNVGSFAESPGTWDNVSSQQYSGLSYFYGWFVNEYSSSTLHYPSLAYNPDYFTHYSEQVTLIDSYLSDLGLEEFEDYFHSVYFSVLPGAGMYNYIINELQNGRPVLANTPEHSFVVYGYVPDTHQLIVHNGWKQGHTHDVFDCDNLPSGTTAGIQYASSFAYYLHTHSYLYHNGNYVYCSCGDEAWAIPYIHKHQMALHYGHPSYFYCTICGYQDGGLL